MVFTIKHRALDEKAPVTSVSDSNFAHKGAVSDPSRKRKVAVPGTDRTVAISEDMLFQFEQVFYRQYDRVVEGRPLLDNSQFGNFEPAMYLQLDCLAWRRRFHVSGNPRDGQYVSEGKAPRGFLCPSVIQTNTAVSRVNDLVTTLAAQVFLASRGSEAYDWSLRALIEVQTDDEVYDDENLPGPGWVCIRRATQERLEDGIASQNIPGSKPGMAPWIALDPFSFPELTSMPTFTTPAYTPFTRPLRGTQENKIRNLGVGGKLVDRFSSRSVVYSIARKMRGEGIDRAYRINILSHEENLLEVTRIR